MSKNKFGLRKIFSKTEEDCCSVEIEEIKKEDNNSRNKLNETKSKKATN